MLRNLIASALLGVLVMSTITPSAAADEPLTVLELAAPGGFTTSAGLAMNDAQQVAGFLTTGGAGQAPALWQDGQARLLGGSGAVAGINHTGTAVGFTQPGQATRATEWSADGGVVDLGTLGGVWAQATALNEAGTVVGYSDTAGGTHAFKWEPATGIRDLGSPEQGFSYAYAINTSGDVAGTADGLPVMWDSAGNLHVLDASERGVAYGINDSGVLVGDVAGAPTIWQSGIETPLPSGQATRFGHAAAVNSAGTTVGSVQVLDTATGLPAYDAVVWQDAKMCDLNTLLGSDSDWHLTEASAIDDGNAIVGSGSRAGIQRGFWLQLSQDQLDACAV